MTLDVSRVLPQIRALTEHVRAETEGGSQSLEHALAALLSADPAALREKVTAQTNSFAWRPAGILENVSSASKPGPLPPDFTVVASDGSHVQPERHRPAACFLMNMGSVSLRYGSAPAADLDSKPELFFGDELSVPLRKGAVRRQPVDAALLGMKRTAREAREAADLAGSADSGIPTLALMDGTLILWEPADGDEAGYMREHILKEGLLAALDRIRTLAETRQVAVASYISLPRSSELVNTLRLQLCPFPQAQCEEKCGSNSRERECRPLDGLLDRQIFERRLHVGERSAVFRSLVPVVQEHYREHEVHFFYLRLDEEVARVEAPKWVAMNTQLLDLTHTLLLDQCRRGLGYPVALSEAHEQAVLTGADRELFWQVVEGALAEAGLPINTSAKSRSKRSPWL